MHTTEDRSAVDPDRPGWQDPVIDRLLKHIENEQFKGYDPYDILKSKVPFLRFGVFAAAVATQFHKRNPVNLRKILGIEKGINPKAIGILLDAVSGLQRLHPTRDYASVLEQLFELVISTESKGYKGACWGYDFGWASPGKYVPPYAPSGVVTSVVIRGVDNYYRLTGDIRARAMVEQSARFVMNELPITKDDSGLVISYTPFKRDICYNASLFAAEILARAFAINGDERLRETAREASRYVVSRQHADGRWNYSLDPVTGREREQVDFHQGYVIDSLCAIAELTGGFVQGQEASVQKGLLFYRDHQFSQEGRSLWRLPHQYPTDIHHQSQGILTFSRASRFFKMKEHLDFATTVARWTMQNMYDPDSGTFHYRKHRWFTDRTPYLRWSNAWMLLALVDLKQAE